MFELIIAGAFTLSVYFIGYYVGRERSIKDDVSTVKRKLKQKLAKAEGEIIIPQTISEYENEDVADIVKNPDKYFNN